MKKLLFLAAIVVLFIVSNMVSYHIGLEQTNSKNYEAACLQSDFIRYLIDHFDGETECANIGMEIEECYYEFFDGLDIGLFNTDYIKSVRDFEEYSWCY